MHLDTYHKPRSSALPRLAIVPALVALSLLAACGNDKGKEDKSTQAAARVNGQELTVHQINLVLERQPGLKADQAEAAGRQVLEGLIDQEIVVQKAEEEKMDRDPKVVQLLDAQRRATLARFYLDKVSASAVSQPSADDIKKYYDSKPGLFSNRRIYMLQEFTIQGTPEQTQALQAQLEATSSVQTFAETLKASGLKFGVNQVTQPAESLPMNVVDRLANVKDGHALYEQGNGAMKAVLVAASREQPLTLEQAKPLIERFLTETRRQEWVKKQVQDMRAAAKVEYIGKFAEKAASAPATGAASAAAPAAEPVASAPDAAASKEALDANSLSKGLSGLK